MDIAIIGMGVRMPLADDIQAFWDILKNGTCCVRKIPVKRRDDYEKYCKLLGIVSPLYIEAAYLEYIDRFDYEFFGISPKEANIMDPNQRIFLETVWSAIEDAGYGGEFIKGSKTGVFVGYCGEQEYRKMVADVEPSFLNMSVIGNCESVIGGRISHILNLKGPNMMINTVCSSSLVAVHQACESLQNKECEMAIAGGIQLHILPIRKIKVGIESKDGRTRTFDDSADGTGCGEGAGALLLKPLEYAINEGDSIHAVIKGSAVNHDGYSVGISAPNPIAQEEVILTALEKANVLPQEISYIEAHGTGTKLGDPIEIEGIKRAYAKKTAGKNFCAIGSVKTNIGHLDGAAGIAGLIKTVLCLKNKMLVPSLFFNKPNKNIDFESSPVYVNTKLKYWDTNSLRRCGVSSFGFSGTNCHIILEESVRVAVEKEKQIPFHLFVLSAKNRESLSELIKRYILLLDEAKELALKDICYTVSAGRGHYQHRMAIIAQNTQDLCCKLKQYADKRTDGELSQYIFSSEASFMDGERMFKGKNAESVYAQVINEMEKGAEAWNKKLGLINDMAFLYVYGWTIEWKKIYSSDKFNKINLPVYPFLKKRCWLSLEPEGQYGRGVSESVSNPAGNEKSLAELEQSIAKIAASTLGLHEIGIYEDLFDLGADSIILIKIIEEITVTEGVDLKLSEVIECPVIHDIAIMIQKAKIEIPEEHNV